MLVRSLVLGLILPCAVAVAQVGPAKSSQISRLPLSTVRDQNSLSGERTSVASADTIRLLALMVDFQTTTGTLSTGTGKFQLGATSAVMIDPPPHDSSYFADKLQFLSNYFRKVSNGKVTIRGEVYGKTVTLPKQMSAYSPAKDGSDDKPLANLLVDSWHLADSLYPSIQFSNYQAFVIFHAGVGRDLDLVAAFGFDPAPFDIPSLTFNLTTLRKYLGDPSYAGIPVDGGTFRITNTMVLPETQTRILPTSKADTLQGSINGLLANSFGSFLGLPDLFNTKTNFSGIGMFGLMDVAGGIGFYGGLFPPEPSAWEKIFLGWATPIIVGQGVTTLDLPAVGLKTGRDTIYKIPITDKEYFLLENRSRDPKGNGQALTVRRGTSIVTLKFPTDTSGFTYDNVRAVNGSVIDVEDFDWAVPGSTSYGRILAGGGILIWHVDENVIARNLASNTINADFSHPGVYVEEADGSRDIGRSYDPFTEPGAGSEYGSPLDFWFKENEVLYLAGTDTVNFYKNVFDNNSNPNSKSHNGAASLISVRQFTNRSPRMTAAVEVGDSRTKRISGLSRNLLSGSGVTQLSAISGTLLAGANGRIYAFGPNGTSRTKDTSGLLSTTGGGFAPAATDFGTGILVAAGQDSTLTIINTNDSNGDGIFESVQTTPVRIGERISTPPLFADLSVTPSIVVGTTRGSVLNYSYTGTLQKKSVVSTSSVCSIAVLPTASLSKPSELFFTCGGRIYGEQNSVALGDSTFPWMLATGTSRSGSFVVAAERRGRRVVAYTRELTQKLFDVSIGNDTLQSVSIGDVDADGEKDIVIVSDRRLAVYNIIGSMLDGFPITAPGSENFVGDALIADVDGDGSPEILAQLSGGSLRAYQRGGMLLPSFPIQMNSGGTASAAIFRSSSGSLGIASLTSSGVLQGIEISRQYSPESIVWSQYLRDARHSNADGLGSTGSPSSTEFMPKSKVYNWPNPTYGSTTNIRYYTSENAAITVMIFDLAGLKIAELKGQSMGGLDGELVWDVSKIQSGVYLGRIEAAGGNKTDVAFIKIAVVK